MKLKKITKFFFELIDQTCDSSHKTIITIYKVNKKIYKYQFLINLI